MLSETADYNIQRVLDAHLFDIVRYLLRLVDDPHLQRTLSVKIDQAENAYWGFGTKSFNPRISGPRPSPAKPPVKGPVSPTRAPAPKLEPLFRSSSSKKDDTIAPISESFEQRHPDVPLEVRKAGALETEIRGIDDFLAKQAESVQLLLRELEGKSCSTDFEQVRHLVEIIQFTADRLGRLFECPKCSQPAAIRYVKNSRSRNGIFSFVHAGTTHSGGIQYPALKLVVPKPDRRRQTSRS